MMPRGIELAQKLQEKDKEFSLIYCQADTYRFLSEFSGSQEEEYLLESIRLFLLYFEFAKGEQNGHGIHCVAYNLGRAHHGLSFYTNTHNNLDTAIRFYEQALENCMTPVNRSSVLLSLGRVYRSLSQAGIDSEKNLKQSK